MSFSKASPLILRFVCYLGKNPPRASRSARNQRDARRYAGIKMAKLCLPQTSCRCMQSPHVFTLPLVLVLSGCKKKQFALYGQVTIDNCIERNLHLSRSHSGLSSWWPCWSMMTLLMFSRMVPRKIGFVSHPGRIRAFRPLCGQGPHAKHSKQ